LALEGFLSEVQHFFIFREMFDGASYFVASPVLGANFADLLTVVSARPAISSLSGMF
jgi:hypothetical protein